MVYLFTLTATANLGLARGNTLDTVDPSDFLLLDSDETLNNDVSFTESVSIQGNIEVDGLINTVDIEEVSLKFIKGNKHKQYTI